MRGLIARAVRRDRVVLTVLLQSSLLVKVALLLWPPKFVFYAVEALQLSWLVLLPLYTLFCDFLSCFSVL